MFDSIEKQLIVKLHEGLRSGKYKVSYFHWSEDTQSWGIVEDESPFFQFNKDDADKAMATALRWICTQINIVGVAIITSNTFAVELRDMGFTTHLHRVMGGNGMYEYIEVFSPNLTVTDDPDREKYNPME